VRTFAGLVRCPDTGAGAAATGRAAGTERASGCTIDSLRRQVDVRQTSINPRVAPSLQSVLQNDAASDDHVEVFSLTDEHPKVSERIAIDEQEVGERIRLQYAQ
jgi:hypothetical protein